MTKRIKKKPKILFMITEKEPDFRQADYLRQWEHKEYWNRMEGKRESDFII